ncbi:MAG: hypothetical protein ACREUY_00860 [Burkholderiales bacterium]
MTDFGADVAFGKVPQKLREHYGIEVPISAAQIITKQHGARIKQERVRLERLPRGGVPQLIGELDGSMLPMVSIAARTDKAPQDGRKRRQLSWREARLSVVRAPDQIKGRYAATMGDPAQAGELFVDSLIRAGGGQRTQLHCVGDGAPWIANQIKQRLGAQAHYLIDFYHLSEYLSGAAEVVAGAHKREWLSAQQQRMKANGVGTVLEALRAHQAEASAPTAEPDLDPVQACRQYMENRLSYFDYAGALKAGLPIGSGEVESGHRSVIQARLKLAGAWWQEKTAESMLALRTLRANDEWETYWSEARQAAA